MTESLRVNRETLRYGYTILHGAPEKLWGLALKNRTLQTQTWKYCDIYRPSCNFKSRGTCLLTDFMISWSETCNAILKCANTVVAAFEFLTNAICIVYRDRLNAIMYSITVVVLLAYNVAVNHGMPSK